nr:MAG TPA: hypothetical protein [Bacteriophage sp.]
MSLLDCTNQFLRIDGDYAEAVVQGMIDAASDFILSGTGVAVAEADPQSVTVMQMIVAWWYEDRNPAKSTSAASLQDCPWAIKAQMIQLKNRGDSDDSASTQTDGD